MKKLLKALSMILFSLLVVCMIHQSAQAASHEDFSLFDYEQKGGEFYTDGDYEYIIIDDEAYITEVNRTISGYVEVPSQLGGYPVAFLYGMSFAYCNEITEVTIPDTVITIGFNCFRECKKLTTVTLGENVTTFIGQAFYQCPSFTTLNWGPKVTKIGRRNFENCDALVSIAIPDTVTTMGEYMFAYCDNLTSVTLSENLTTLEQAVLHKCPKLESVVIPDSVQAVGKMCFDSSTGLKSVVIGKGVKSIGWDAFRACTSLTTVTMNDAITVIDEYAFKDCEKLESIVIPDTTTTIGNHAFAGCESMTSAKIGNSVQTIGDCAFEDCAITEIILPDTLTSIGVQGFYNCSQANTVKIGSNVEKIGARAFQYCGMAEIVIPESVTTLGNEAFSCCINARTLSIGSGITELREKTFYHCTVLESVSIGSGLTSIGEQALTDCSSLKFITVAGDNPNFSSDDRGVMFNKDKTVLIQAPGGISGTYAVPDGVHTIGKYSFYQSKQLEKVSFPDSLRTIEGFAFYGCDKLEHVDYGNGVVEAPGSMTFAYCHKLTEVNLPLSFKTIGSHMYRGCEGLVNIVIPDGVETIGQEAFAYNPNLKSVVLGKSVKEIKKSAFEFVNHMTQITVHENLETVQDNAFYRCDDLTDVYYNGTSNQWYAITIGRNNEKFQYAHIHCIEPHEHNFKKYISDNNATCTEDGTETAKCEKCDLTDTRTAPGSALGHIGGSATCITKAICDRCATPYGNVDVSNHIHTELKNVKTENCTEDGYSGDLFCLDCSTVVTSGEVIPAHHTYTTTVIPPTYTKPGYTEYLCSICGHTYQDNDIKAKGLPKPASLKAKFDPITGGALLTWEHDGESTAYKVYKATSSKGKYSLYKTVSNASVTVSVPVGKTYYFKVMAVYDTDPSLNSGYSSVVKATGKCAQPVITVTAGSTGKPIVKWGKVTGAKKYDVYRATSETGKYTKVKTVSTTSYTDTAAKVGSIYYYKIKAIASKSTYNSSDSEIKSCLTILSKPTVTISVSSTTGKPTVSWKKITGAVAYEVYRAESADGVFVKLPYTAGLTYADTTVAMDTDYWYVVKAIGSSDSLNSTSTVKQVHTTLAKPVVSFKVDSVSGKPVLSWSVVEGAVEYKVYRSTSATKSYKVVKTTDNTTYTDTSATIGKGYYYKVIAIGANCKSAYSTYKKLTAKCAQPVINVTTVSTGKPQVKWVKITGAKKYEVYRATSLTGTYKKIKTVTTTTYTDTAAKVGTTYYYKVKAVASGTKYNSIFSEIKSRLVILGRPVLSVSANSSTGKPVLSWKKIADADKYEIYRSVNDGEFTLIKVQSTTSYTDKDTVVDGKYTYKVKAIAEDPTLNSLDSTAKTVYCACAKPVIKGKLNGKKPMVSWNPVDGATKYYVYRSKKSGSGYKKIKEVTDCAYTDSTAKKGATYYYKVVAVSANASSAQSSYVKIKSK